MNNKKPVICGDGIHCGECPYLKPYDDEYDLGAKCELTGNELMWHDFWIAECERDNEQEKKI